jgi:hypothetical protein
MIVKTAIDFCHLTYDGNKIANAAHAAYWLACQHSEDCNSPLKTQEDSILEGFRSMASALGYRVEKIEEKTDEELLREVMMGGRR